MILDRRGAGRQIAYMRFVRLAPLAALLAGCTGATDVSIDDVLMHRSIWLSQGVTSYRYVYEQTGFFICCINNQQITVTVRQDTVRSAVVAATGQPIVTTGSSFTITAVFDQAEAAARDGTLHSISYDAVLGYPTQIDISAGPDRSGSFFAAELQPAP